MHVTCIDFTIQTKVSTESSSDEMFTDKANSNYCSIFIYDIKYTFLYVYEYNFYKYNCDQANEKRSKVTKFQIAFFFYMYMYPVYALYTSSASGWCIGFVM